VVSGTEDQHVYDQAIEDNAREREIKPCLGILIRIICVQSHMLLHLSV
jgi:hypothetical protein